MNRLSNWFVEVGETRKKKKMWAHKSVPSGKKNKIKGRAKEKNQEQQRIIVHLSPSSYPIIYYVSLYIYIYIVQRRVDARPPKDVMAGHGALKELSAALTCWA